MHRDNRIVILDGDVETAVIAEFESDRRELIRRGLAFGGVAVAASSIPLLMSVRNAFAKAQGDAGILEAAVGLEQTAVFAYQAAIDSKLLHGDALAAARLFHGQEQEHAKALIGALTDVGGTAPPPPKSVADVDKVLPGLGQARSTRAIAAFAVELETAAVAAYYDAQRKLQDSKLLQTSASIMANEGQHLVILRGVLGRQQVPNAFETGEK